MLGTIAKALRPEKADPHPADDMPRRYERPRILLVDTPGQVGAVLEALGFSTELGSFGTPYRTQMRDAYEPVVPNGSMPDDYGDSDIIFADLQGSGQTLAGATGERVVSEGEPDWWCSCARGVVDPRPRVAMVVRDAICRILGQGGAAIVFAAQRTARELVLGRVRRLALEVEHSLPFDNWSFLSAGDTLLIVPDCGSVIVEARALPAELGSLAALVACAGTTYDCTLNWRGPDADRFVPLAVSKFGDPVAALIKPAGVGEGVVIILPGMTDRAAAARLLVEEVLPEISPCLFPFHEGTKWLSRAEYELPDVTLRRQSMARIRQKADDEVLALEKEISGIRQQYHFLDSLVTETGSALVEAVKSALAFLGFGALPPEHVCSLRNCYDASR